MAELPDESTARSAAASPDEPFACPHCGQMLAPSCRVCPSCRQTIDPNDIARPEVTIPIAEQVIPLPTKEFARFSWGIFFMTLGAWFVIAFLTEGLLGYEKSQFALAGLVILSSVWVYHDAKEKNIPKALRWSIGSLLLWILVFPWYLARRRTPKAPCPLIEGEGSRVARTFLIILFVVFVVYALMMLIRGPAHHQSGTKEAAPKSRKMPSGKIAGLTYSTQQPAKAPSEASQT